MSKSNQPEPQDMTLKWVTMTHLQCIHSIIYSETWRKYVGGFKILEVSVQGPNFNGVSSLLFPVICSIQPPWTITLPFPHQRPTLRTLRPGWNNAMEMEMPLCLKHPTK